MSYSFLTLTFAFSFVLLTGCEEDIQWKNFPEKGRLAFQQGHYAEAERLLLKALNDTGQWTTTDPRKAATLQQLGELYRHLGRYEEAESSFWQAMPIWAQTIGSEHPVMASSLTGIALSYFAQGKLREAEPLFKRALAIREKALGRNHPDIALGLEEYAQLLRQTQRPEKADQLDHRRMKAIAHKEQ